MADWHIAEINVATARYPLDHRGMAEFMTRLEEINAVADRSPGFVWRLQTEAGDATGIQVTDDPRFIVNMSVWHGVESLFDFVYASDHVEVMAKRRQWFERAPGAYQVLWWIPSNHTPSVEDGMRRLEQLDRIGPTPTAFTFKSSFPAPDALGDPKDLEPEAYCRA